MTTRYVHAATPGQLWACLTGLRARTVIFDVEPLVAFRDTDQSRLEDGIATILAAVADADPTAVVFAINSTRRPSILSTVAWETVRFVASACKPLQVAGYRDGATRAARRADRCENRPPPDVQAAGSRTLFCTV